MLKDFRRWIAEQNPHSPGMVGQTETHFPCKAAYAVAVFDHDQERFTALRVMMPEGRRMVWYEMEVEKLTMQLYTDATLLPKVAAIHSLPDLTNVTPAVTSDMQYVTKRVLACPKTKRVQPHFRPVIAGL